MSHEVTLGNTVQDRVSGFMGIAVARHSYLQGCDRVSVQPPVDEENKLPDLKVFDEPDLEVLDEGVAAHYSPAGDEDEDKPGGPHYEDDEDPPEDEGDDNLGGLRSADPGERTTG